MTRGLLATVIAFIAAAMSVAGQSQAGKRQSAPMPANLEIKQYCNAGSVQTALRGLAPAVSIREIPDGPKFTDGTRYVAASGSIPAYCQVTGSFVTNEKTGKTANFLATLPENWNGKYLQLGCGANCGAIFQTNNPADPGSVVALQGYPLQSLEKGYASFSTDEGHVGYEMNFDWSVEAPGRVNLDGVRDFYQRADRILAVLGKQFAVRFYSLSTGATHQITRSYFQGCSGGGRDGLVAASYFPEEFDGIIVGSPAANLMGIALQNAGEALAQLRSPEADVPPYLANRIAYIVEAKCDADDGVRDGIIQNPMACSFRADRDLPRCDGAIARTQCFTPQQIETISTRLSAVTDESGNVLQPGFAVSDTRPARLPKRPADITSVEPYRPNDPDAGRLWNLGNGELRYMALGDPPGFHTRNMLTFQPQSSASVSSFHTIVPRAFADRIFESSRPGIGNDPSLAAKLLKSKTRVLMWSNLGDNQLTPYMAINYYKLLARHYGGYERLQRNVRLFTIPGSDHCSGTSTGPSNFDPLSAMEGWVERSEPPVALMAALYDPEKPGPIPGAKALRSMPLCMFPMMAHFSGAGDINDATNWSCPAGDTSLLKVGESGRLAGVVD